MTTPVSNANPTSIQNTSHSNMPTAAPIGVGSQMTTIASASNSNNTDYWQTVKTGLDSFGEFIRNLVVKSFEAIRLGISFISDWIAGKSTESSSETTPSHWQLPAETPQAPIAGTSQDPFAALTITDQERQKIYTIIHTMGSSQGMMGLINLARQKTTLEQLGQEINHINPLKFLEYILKHDMLKKDLDNLSQGNFTWTPFVNGISEKMRRESATLRRCQIGFARSLNINPADIDPYLARSNWEGFVKFLIDVKNGRRNSTWVEPVIAPTAPVDSTISTPPPPSSTLTVISTDANTSTTILMTPSPVVHLAHLPFESEDVDILTDLMTRYSQNTRLRLFWEYNSLHLQWTHLGARHPLKILVYLYSTPLLMTQMNTIFGYYGTKSMFMDVFTEQLSRIPFVEVRPYIDEFAQACHLDPNLVRRLIQNDQWYELVEELHRSYLARNNVS